MIRSSIASYRQVKLQWFNFHLLNYYTYIDSYVAIVATLIILTTWIIGAVAADCRDPEISRASIKENTKFLRRSSYCDISIVVRLHGKVGSIIIICTEGRQKERK